MRRGNASTKALNRPWVNVSGAVPAAVPRGHSKLPLSRRRAAHQTPNPSCTGSLMRLFQALARPDHRVCVALRNHQRRTLGDVEEQRLQWVAGLGCEDEAVRHQALAEAFLCAAASRALTAPTPSARDGSALRAS